MYPTTHGHTGAIIVTASVALAQLITPGSIIVLAICFIVGLTLAFLSHFPLDYIGEYNYGGFQKLVRAQLPSAIVFIVCCGALLFSENFIFLAAYIFGYTAGNGPDIIDKKIGHLKHERPKNKRFSCHNGNGLLSFKNWKLGYPVKCNLNKTDQTQLQFLMTVAIVVLTIYILK